jgi:hypothetical protein
MTNQNILTYRDYQPGDEVSILALFRQVFHREMSPSFWRWRYRDDPFGQSVIRMAFDGDRLVGHFAAIPMKVAVTGEIYTDIFPMTAMTHPDYGGRGIFTSLMDQTYRSCAQKGASLVYGFCNQNSLGPSVRYGYRNVIKTVLWQKKLNANSITGPPIDKVEPVSIFDDRIDALWETVKNDYPVINIRNKEFLNWRYIRAPHTEYSCFVYADGGAVAGYIVLKVYTEPGLIKAHIVDLLSVRDEFVVRALIGKAYRYFSEKGIYDLSCWMMGSPFYRGIFEAEGFFAGPDATNFGVKRLDLKNALLSDVEDTSLWYATMGDSDVY